MTVYQSRSVDETITHARQVVDGHQLDGATGRCAACGRAAPCRTANSAVNLLAAMGVLDTVIQQPASSQFRPAGSLLTFGWKIALGVEKHPGRRASMAVRR